MKRERFTILACPAEEKSLSMPMDLLVMRSGDLATSLIRVHASNVQVFGRRPGTFRFAGLGQILESEDEDAAKPSDEMLGRGWLSTNLGTGNLWIPRA